MIKMVIERRPSQPEPGPGIERVIATLRRRIEAAGKLPEAEQVLALKLAVKEAIAETPSELLFSGSWRYGGNGSNELTAAFVGFTADPGSDSFLLTPKGKLLIRTQKSEDLGLIEATNGQWLKLGERLLRPFEVAHIRSLSLNPPTVD